MSLINKVDMVCLSPVGYGVWVTFRALVLRRALALLLHGVLKSYPCKFGQYNSTCIPCNVYVVGNSSFELYPFWPKFQIQLKSPSEPPVSKYASGAPVSYTLLWTLVGRNTIV